MLISTWYMNRIPHPVFRLSVRLKDLFSEDFIQGGKSSFFLGAEIVVRLVYLHVRLVYLHVVFREVQVGTEIPGGRRENCI